MAQIVEFVGNSPDAAELFAFGSDVVIATAASVTAATNRKSIFSASFSGVSVGEYQFIALDGTEADAIWTVAITSADGVFTAYERSVNTSAVASNGTVTRSLTDTEPIQFSWPVTGATLTGEVDFNSANDYQPVLGDFAFLYTEGGVNYYTLSHNEADRPTEEGTARYKVTDGVRTKWFNLRMAVSSGGGGGSGFTAVVVSRLPIGSTQGWPVELTIGDAYLAETASSLPLFVKDIDDNILAAMGSKTFADADFVGTLRLSPLTDGTRELDSPPTTIQVTSEDTPGILFNDDTDGGEFFHLQIPRAKTLLGVTKTRYSVQFILNWGDDATFERTIHLGETKFLRKNAPFA